MPCKQPPPQTQDIKTQVNFRLAVLHVTNVCRTPLGEHNFQLYLVSLTYTLFYVPFAIADFNLCPFILTDCNISVATSLPCEFLQQIIEYEDDLGSPRTQNYSPLPYLSILMFK